jgi:hypothetical protein
MYNQNMTASFIFTGYQTDYFGGKQITAGDGEELLVEAGPGTLNPSLPTSGGMTALVPLGSGTTLFYVDVGVSGIGIMFAWRSQALTLQNFTVQLTALGNSPVWSVLPTPSFVRTCSTSINGFYTELGCMNGVDVMSSASGQVYTISMGPITFPNVNDTTSRTAGVGIYVNFVSVAWRLHATTQARDARQL